jgi:hypothetical protein
MWRFAYTALPRTCSASQAGHVCLGTGLINKHQFLRIKLRLALLPALARLLYVRPISFAGMERFFYNASSAALSHYGLSPASSSYLTRCAIAQASYQDAGTATYQAVPSPERSVPQDCAPEALALSYCLSCIPSTSAETSYPICRTTALCVLYCQDRPQMLLMPAA